MTTWQATQRAAVAGIWEWEIVGTGAADALTRRTFYVSPGARGEQEWGG